MRTKLEPRPKPLGPEESPEARTARAQELDAQLRQLIKNTDTRKLQFSEAIGLALDAPQEKERGRLIWAGAVRLANCDVNGSSLAHAGSMLRATNALCFSGHKELEDIQGELYRLELYEDAVRRQTEKRTKQDAFEQILRELQPGFRNMLAWVADPNRAHPKDREAALSFLLQHGEQELTAFSYDTNGEFDPTGNQGAPLYFWRRPDSVRSLLAPVTRFIFEQLEQYHDGVLSLEEAVPILLCRRKGCGKFALIERRTKDFCSNKCRTLHRQKENPEAHAAYMRRYREENYTKPKAEVRSAERL